MLPTTAPRQRHPSLPSTASINHQSSLRSHRPTPPPISTVITSPPWAKDEPPSPNDLTSIADTHHATESRPSDVASYQSSHPPPPNHASPWWAFTHPRPKDIPLPDSISPSKSERKGLSWLPTSAIRDATSIARREKDPESAHETPTPTSRPGWNLSITLPPQAAAPFTLAHNRTPGWESPWTARNPAHGPLAGDDSYGFGSEKQPDDANKNLSVWQRRKKIFRAFILTNTYVPLLFRFVNITFTTAALGIAIRIRKWEMQFHVMGAVGSSPTLVIIFAPLTLVHVMFAIYLDYFGRPLGLWRTSAKLAHTLSEVLFICAWSAALSLCFDNFFTSLVPCAAPSSTAWYNELPRPQSPIPDIGRNQGGPGDWICDDQLALICLVGVGLLMYCINLIISLFRIFEKVKYHPAAALRPT